VAYLPHLARELAETCLNRLEARADRARAAQMLVFLLLPAATTLDRHEPDLAQSVVEAFSKFSGTRLPSTATEALKRLWEACREEEGDAQLEQLASFALSLASAYAIYAASAKAFAPEELIRAPL